MRIWELTFRYPNLFKTRKMQTDSVRWWLTEDFICVQLTYLITQCSAIFFFFLFSEPTLIYRSSAISKTKIFSRPFSRPQVCHPTIWSASSDRESQEGKLGDGGSSEKIGNRDAPYLLSLTCTAIIRKFSATFGVSLSGGFVVRNCEQEM